MSRFQLRSVAFVAALVALAGCSESALGPHDEHRAHIQVLSTSVDLADYDLCWATENGEVRVELHAAMLDESATRQLGLPLELGARASLVAPGEACDAPSATPLSLDWSGLAEGDEDVVLLVADLTQAGANGRLLSTAPHSEDSHALRSSACEGAEPYARRETYTNASGECQTRARLYECQTVYLGMGESLSGYVETYDSGWLDCSRPQCDYIADL